MVARAKGWLGQGLAGQPYGADLNWGLVRFEFLGDRVWGI